MSQVEVTKVVSYALIGPASDEAAVSKVVAYVLLEPGDGGSDDGTARQAHTYAQILGA